MLWDILLRFIARLRSTFFIRTLFAFEVLTPKGCSTMTSIKAFLFPFESFCQKFKNRSPRKKLRHFTKFKAVIDFVFFSNNLQTNVFALLKTTKSASLSAREVGGSILGPIKSSAVPPTTLHRCCVSSKLCWPGAKPLRWVLPLVTRFGVIPRE